MRAIAIIFVALGILSVPSAAVSLRQKASPNVPNQYITMERYQKIKNRTAQWKAYKPEKNPLFHLSDTELKNLLGLQNDPEAEAQAAGGMIEVEADQSLPTSFDARQKWGSCTGLTTVRNQGSCGSCWAFSSTGALADRYCITSTGRVNKLLSPQYTVSCDKTNAACNGGNMARAWSYLTSYGTVEDACVPYQSANKFVPTCPTKCSNGAALKKYTCTSGSVVVKTNPNDIKAELMANGPMDVAFTVYQDFYNYRSGIYKYTSGMKVGGHAVKLVGWGVSNGINYWVIQNSWGATWGESGFFRIQQGQCGIAASAYGCKPNLTGF